jgi:transcriptional regulator
VYTPASFRLDDREHLHAVMEAHSFATLIAHHDDGTPEITHLPVLLDRGVAPNGAIRAHVARANPFGRLAAEGRPIVAIFHGPHAYVSASWYGEPTRQVPTWNYVVVHAHGRARRAMNRDELLRLLADLSAENERDAAPWRYDSLDEKLRDGLVAGVIGFSIEIERLEGKAKVSQNRTPDDQARVLARLEAEGQHDVAAWMRRLGVGT